MNTIASKKAPSIEAFSAECWQGLVLSKERQLGSGGVGMGFAVPQLKALHKAIALQTRWRGCARRGGSRRAPGGLPARRRHSGPRCGQIQSARS